MKETPQLTKKQILFELFEGKNGYINNPESRAIGMDGKCKYLADDGNQCAVGKCMLNKWQKMFPGLEIGVLGVVNKIKQVRLDDFTLSNYGSVSQEDMDAVLLKRYRGHEVYFWGILQNLHDVSVNWTKDGLTTIGITYLNRIKQAIDAEDSDEAIREVYHNV